MIRLQDIGTEDARLESNRRIGAVRLRRWDFGLKLPVAQSIKDR
jgi:hypothetical protein